MLTKDDPIADVAYGIDNTFASRAVDEGVLRRLRRRSARPAPRRYALPGDDAAPAHPGRLRRRLRQRRRRLVRRRTTSPPPTTLDDLTEAGVQGPLRARPARRPRSPGLAFLLATIAKYGDGWQAYWKKLMANGAKITAGWSDAYEVDFTAGGGNGDRPIVLSYASSPPFTIPKGGDRRPPAPCSTPASGRWSTPGC